MAAADNILQAGEPTTSTGSPGAGTHESGATGSASTGNGSTGGAATGGAATPQIQPARFDSLAFFEALASSARAHPDQYRRLGMTEITLGVKVGTNAYRLVFEDYECTEVTPYDPSDGVDCVLEASRDAWLELIEHLVERGRADSAHTLNSLVLAGERFHLTGEDQLGVDKFYRYNATLQSFFEETANVPLLLG